MKKLPLLSDTASLFLLAFAGWIVMGCTRHAKIPDDTLVIGIENEIKNLDLRHASDANSVHVANLVFQSLTKVGDSLVPELDLASEMKIVKDREFRFTIPKGLRFHDGTPLSAQDVLYNFQQASGPQSRVKSSFDDVEEFAAPDDTTFLIKLKKPKPSFLASDVSMIRIFPKHLGESPSVAKNPVGSGPYKFASRRNRDLLFLRNEGYKTHAPNAPDRLPTFKRLIVRSIEDPTTRFFSMIGGDVDVLINSLSPRRVAEITQEKTLQIIQAPGSTYQYIGFHLQNKKFQDPRVREALSLAIDRKSIINHKLKGFASPASSLLTPQNFFHNPNVPTHEYNPERAKKLLAEAGQSNLEIEIRSSADRDALSILQIIQEQWRQVGVKSRLKSTEFADFFSSIQKGQFECYSLRWTAIAEPDLLNRVFHSREVPPGRNRVFYSNPSLDKVLDLAAVETQLEKRKNLYFEAQNIISKETPYISLWYPDNIAVTSNRLKDFKLGPTGSWLKLLYAKKESVYVR